MAKAAPAWAALPIQDVKGALGTAHVFGLQAFWTCLDLKLYLRAFIEALISIHLNGGVVDEYVLSAGALDKAVALRSVEPFHDTFFSHY